MDNIVLIAGAIAIIAVLAATFVLDPFGLMTTSSTGSDDSGTVTGEATSPVTQDDSTSKPSTENTDPNLQEPDYENQVYGEMLTELQGECNLYKAYAKNEYRCFGTAGNYSTMATNEYGAAESDEYFCKATKYGCQLYLKTEFHFT